MPGYSNSRVCTHQTRVLLAWCCGATLPVLLPKVPYLPYPDRQRLAARDTLRLAACQLTGGKLMPYWTERGNYWSSLCFIYRFKKVGFRPLIEWLLLRPTGLADPDSAYSILALNVPVSLANPLEAWSQSKAMPRSPDKSNVP
jgi:hypothetical protein